MVLSEEWPQLTFEHRVKRKKEKFTATYDIETQSIKFDGVLRNPLELIELIAFLEYLASTKYGVDEGTKKQFIEYPCQCGEGKIVLVGRGDFFFGPLVGEMFDIHICENRGRGVYFIAG